MTHPVLELITQRARAGSRPGARQDPHRLALVVEGGGMRGVISAAMTAAIEEQGLLDAFDFAIGTSAGALNAAALLAGAAAGCTYEYAAGFAGREFINPLRLLLGRPVVDVAYVLDFSSEQLDADRHGRTVNSPVELHCVATEVETAAPRDLADLKDLDELRCALLASSRLPWVGGDPVPFRGRHWLDGGLCEPIPLLSAIDAGATHALVLLTRPRGARVEPPSDGLADRIVRRRLRALNPALVDAYRRRPRVYAEMTNRVTAATDQPGTEPPYVMGIVPPADSVVPSRLDRDADRLRAAADLGRRTAESALIETSREG